MQPHEQRVVDEKKELDEKLTKLTSFISSSPIFSGLDPVDQDLLRDQRGTMNSYSEILAQRIARFAS